ncbi:MAG: DUF2203 domain-containing protein [Phycisphaerae bacterium]|jgi:hypothetical protein|nr:DUF2203 domain-containing protein [Phycisphaerae bacterium]
MMNLNHTAQEAPAGQRIRHFFTLDEANSSLVLVRRIVADVVKHYERLLQIHETVEALEAANLFGQLEDARDELVFTADSIRICLEEIEDVGAELCDWELGIVDFPAMVEGREVRLCWRADESRVTHWHELDSCHLGRYEISTLHRARGARETITA